MGEEIAVFSGDEGGDKSRGQCRCRFDLLPAQDADQMVAAVEDLDATHRGYRQGGQFPGEADVEICSDGD